ncbi:autotransporter secretion outer membrane protein TamA [Ectothiorhodospira mobilis]|uniref:Translocation and assembly module subunit TamA n=1 Tax=Ectothiorhodospira mobilis TaxID=195064 RepID=A0A1I4S564_ECTMO|nr:autotransporter assembly complex family protein [Ectothiorhodospira mobilis]SFM59635.1 autotransporter secretion outer membrane protein TamA [Ectothiorhodospira mobilis]
MRTARAILPPAAGGPGRWRIWGQAIGLLGLCLLLAPPLTAQTRPTLEILGVEGAPAENIRAHLGPERADCDLPAWQEEPWLEDAEADTLRALRALGFYTPSVELDLRRTQDCWRLEVRVEPGPPVRVRRVDIRLQGEAAKDPAFTALLDAPPIREGQVLRHDDYARLKSELGRLASARGYFDNRFTRTELRVDPKARAAEVIVHMDSGPRYRLGAVTLEQDAFHEPLLRRFVPFEEGEPYATDHLIRMQQAFIDSGYFSQVRVEPRPDAARDRAVPIHVRLVPRNRWSYLAGIGASTDTGPHLRLGVENHRVNRAGHRYDARLELSPVRSSANLDYEIPRGDPARERILLSAGWQTEDTDSSDSDLYGLGIAHVRQMPSGWMQTRALRYEQETYRISDEEDTSHLLIPSLELSRTRADDPVFPRRGWHLRGTLRGAADPILSSTSFLQAHGSAKYIRPLGGGRLLLRAELGTTSVDQLEQLPSSLRFFAGGDASVRGYAYQALGPRDADGEVIGGRHLITASVEVDHPVKGPWGVAAFVDGGNTFNRMGDYSPRYGAGVGLRWRSPIGPVRVDLAHPVDGDDAVRLHLSMGMDL